jgi:hypothetical protein
MMDDFKSISFVERYEVEYQKQCKHFMCNVVGRIDRWEVVGR